jgi:hypothetical protein
MIKIEVAFASPALQKIIQVEVAATASIAEAIQTAKIQDHFPDYDLLSLPYGIFGKRIYDDRPYHLQDGDRIEIYRPLNKTPNQKRLERAKNS